MTFYAGQILSADDLNAAFGAGTAISNIFNANGTWNKPTDLNYQGSWVEIWSPGGAGGGAAVTIASENSPGAGGGSGSYSRTWIPAASLPSSVSVTPGTGGVPVSGGTGGTGTTASFGTLVTLTGGTGGAFAGAGTSGAISSSGGVPGQTFGGTYTTGRLMLLGGDGTQGVRISGTFGWAGVGGGGPGAGNRQGPVSVAANGMDGNTPGGGGSGARNTGANAARPGGAGGNGRIVVTDIFG